MRLTDLLLSRQRREESGRTGQEKWKEEVQAVPLELVAAGKFQPRREFEEGALQELAASIEIHGLLQPILVRPGAVGYEVIVGERRLRACRLLGWEVIPAIIRDVEDKEAAEYALIENLQREDLHVLEVAEGYERLLQEFDLTQEELGERLGISQANIANKLRLLRLPAKVRQIISREMLSERHGRALLRLRTEAEQLEVAEKIAAEGLSVKDTERLIARLLDRGERKSVRKGRRKLIIKDIRLFTNSVRQLVDTLKSSGLIVDLAEEEDAEQYRILVTVEKPVDGDYNG